MKAKIFSLIAALSMLLPSTPVEGFFPGDDAESLDQFLVTAGFTGYILWQAIDLAKENHFQYLKIISAEYTYGAHTGQFSCPLKDEEKGTVLSFEDETMKFTIICCGVQPDDPDYIDAEVYKDLFSLLDDEDEDEEDLSFDGNEREEDDEDEDDSWFFNF